MRRFKQLKGAHNEAGVDYGPGDVVPSEHDLATLFPNKFEEVPAPPHPAKVTPAPVVEEAAEEEVVEEEEEVSTLGEEITENYAKATEKGLRVWKSERDYFVTTDDEPGKALHKKALKKNEVKPFLSQHGEEE